MTAPTNITDLLRTVDWTSWAPLFFGVQLLTASAWLGAILCVRSLCARARYMADSEEIGRLALAVLSAWTWLPLLASVLAAAARGYALRASFAHDRSVLVGVALAVTMIALHASVRARARRVARGDALGAAELEPLRERYSFNE